MDNPLSKRNRLAIPLPIPDNARSIARQFAAQTTALKSEQVQMNTLAVWVTHDYCQMMGIPTDLEQSDSWNPILRMMANVADLVLPEIGQLECRPIQPEADTCITPPEVWDLRVGYVVVEIDHDCQTAKLLGFTPAVTGERLLVSQLQPPEDLLDHLYTLRQSNQMAGLEIQTQRGEEVTESVINLSQWLNHIFEANWLTVGTFLTPKDLAFNFRSAKPVEQANSPANIRRARLIDFARNLGVQPVVLVVDLKQSEALDKIRIGLQVYPTQGQSYLPPGLKLSMIESSNAVFMEAQARQADNFLQLKFCGKPGKHFKVRINMHDMNYIEEFVI